ncbi:MAG TPA: hypothetical protein VL403_07105 [Candidatus Kryptonia bacterium]|nr:hypothetical protein [Candidatus Kryptonia bacterium]
MTRARILTLALIFSLVGGMLEAVPAFGHQLQPPDIAFWGPFSKPTLQCLLTLHRAADDCFERVVAAHRNCFGRQLAGLPCDTSVRDAHIAAATRRVEQEVDRGCLGGQLTELFFRTYDDAKFDLTNACTTQANAAMTMIYGPALASQAAAGVSGQTQACVEAAAVAGMKLLQRSVGVTSRALDHLAGEIVGPSIKFKALSDADANIASIQQALVDDIGARCPDFEARFGRTAASLLTDVAKRATCVVTAVYVQSTIFCSPLP